MCGSLEGIEKSARVSALSVSFLFLAVFLWVWFLVLTRSGSTRFISLWFWSLAPFVVLSFLSMGTLTSCFLFAAVC